MSRPVAVVNNAHGISFEIMCWMFRDLGYDVFETGTSFSGPLPKYVGGGGVTWTESPSFSMGKMEWKDFPADALFIDWFPENETALRAMGWKGPFLFKWGLPCGPEWFEDRFHPSGRTGLMAFNPAHQRVIRSKTLCPSELIYPPYHHLRHFVRRDRFESHLITVIRNAQGWIGKGVLEPLRDHPKTRLELYGGPDPDWSRVLPHGRLLERLAVSCALYHPKPTDSPGCALLEAGFMGVPVILNRRFMETTEAVDLYQDGKTCLMAKDTATVLEAHCRLLDPKENARLGDGLRDRLIQFSSWPDNKAKIQRLIREVSGLTS